jgi:hypothetical protein
MIKRIESKSNLDIKQSDYEYNRFDAYNDIFYEDVMIEFDKFSYNHAYAMVNNLNFVYAVEMNDIIYIFDIVNLVKEGFNFNWNWREMPKTTEFNRKEKTQKYVGFINIKHSYCEI